MNTQLQPGPEVAAASAASIEPILVDAPVAAHLLSISERSLSSYVREGLIPVVRLGGRVLFDLQSLRNWASQLSK